MRLKVLSHHLPNTFHKVTQTLLLRRIVIWESFWKAAMPMCTIVPWILLYAQEIYLASFILARELELLARILQMSYMNP